MKTNVVYRGDCLAVMQEEIADGSIDMILCDLPYGVTRNKWDEVIPFDDLWKQYKRIIKPNGAILLFADGMFMAKLMVSNPAMWRYNLVWKKGERVSGFLNANKMPLRNHEEICVFYKALPTYNPQFTEGIPLHGKGKVVCRVNQINTGDEIKCLELWNKDKNPEQCLEMLNQVSLASRNVLSQLRQATNHPVLLDFDETCLLNQVLDQPNATIVRHRLSRLAKHTSIPILVEAIRSLQSKLMYFEASSQVGKVYKDRLDHKIMTQPVYRI